jgi:uncharacterized protein YcnI
MRRTIRVASTALVAAVIGALALAGTADAHVTVDPAQAVQGGYTRVAFRVPTESDTASTTKLDVFLPTDQPVASVATMPVPGWTATLQTTKLANPITTDDGGKVTDAVSQITWTATGDAATKPGQFQEFPVSLGPLPKTGSLTFKALQTYSDGSVVRWIDLTTPGGTEPAHPAPVLTLTKDAATAASAAPALAAAKSSGGSNGPALALGIVGAVLGLIGAVLGGLALARAGRTGTPAAPAATPATVQS